MVAKGWRAELEAQSTEWRPLQTGTVIAPCPNAFFRDDRRPANGLRLRYTISRRLYRHDLADGATGEPRMIKDRSFRAAARRSVARPGRRS